MFQPNNSPGHLPELERPLVIIHCVRSIVGGIFKHIADLVKHQSKQGHDVGLIFDSSTVGAFEEANLEELKPFMRLGAIQLPMGRNVSLNDVTVTKTVHALLKSIDVDVLHCHGAKGGVYGRFAASFINRDRKCAGKPKLVTIYSPHGGSLHYSQRSLSGQIYFGVERFMERFTCEFIFVAGYEVETYSRKIGKLRQPWSIAYNGLSAEEFDVVKPSARAVDFVYAGHMRDLKGADLFIDAVEIANARSHEPVHALMIGDGEDLPRYKEDVERRGLTNRIQFLPPMPIRDVFKRTRNLVVPSRAEALPYIVVEALGARVPTLATSVGGIPEIYGSYGHYLLPPGDANLIATAMLDRLSRPEKANDLAGTLRQVVKQKFTVEGMCKKVDKVYLRNLVKAHLPEIDPERYFADEEEVESGVYAKS